MTTRPTNYVLPVAVNRIPGVQVNSAANGSVTISLAAGDSITVFNQAWLPRTSTANKGARLDAICVDYQITSGTLTSVTPTVTQIKFSDNIASPASASIAINAANPTYDLTAGNTTRARNAITTPAFDNDAVGVAGVTVYYVVSVAFVASTATVLNVYAIELETTTDWA